MKVVSPFYSITFVLANILSLKLERTFSCQTHVMSLPHFHSLDVEIYCFKYVPYFKKIYCENAFFSIISEDSLKLWKTVADIFIFAEYRSLVDSPRHAISFFENTKGLQINISSIPRECIAMQTCFNLLIMPSLDKNM